MPTVRSAEPPKDLTRGSLSCSLSERMRRYVDEGREKLVKMMCSRRQQLIQAHESHLEQRMDEMQEGTETGKHGTQTKKQRQRRYVSLEEFSRRKELETAVAQFKEEMTGHLGTFSRSYSALLCRLPGTGDVDMALDEFRAKADRLEAQFERECRRFQSRLPIYAKKFEILDALDTHQVVVIQGETGSGKSTQLMQYMCDDRMAPGASVCTQPRKIAAVTLAQRVTDEMKTTVECPTIGCLVGMMKKPKDKTKALYATDRMLLSEYLKDPELKRFSHIIIDEAHERSLFTDLLIAMIKQLLPRRPDLRVIVTSATLNTDLFKVYFNDCPVIKVPGRMFPVDVHWEENRPSDYDYVKAAVDKVCSIHEKEGPGHILVFLTSQIEIERAIEALTAKEVVRESCCLLPLHGKLQPEEQQMVFDPLREGYDRKVVVATNAAETSVTIPGVVYVVDSGMARVPSFDPIRNIMSLDTKMINKSSADQRKGRAGRTSPGKCYRLYTEQDYNNMASSLTPEILRLHLGSAVLKLLELGVQDIEGFEFVEPPDREALRRAVESLKLLGAVDQQAQLTELGRKMSMLPTEPRLSKMIILGKETGCLQEAMAAAALLSVGANVFYRGMTETEQKKADTIKVKFCDEAGDIVTCLKVFGEWFDLPDKHRQRNSWCVENCVNAKTMRVANDTLKELRFIMKAPKVGLFLNSEVIAKVARAFFLVFLENICSSAGHPDAGYVLRGVDNSTTLIHPSSVLVSLAANPQWLVYGELRRTTQLFICNVVTVRSEWLRELPAGYIDMEQLESQKVVSKTVASLHPLLVSNLIGRRGVSIIELQSQINSACQYNYIKPVVTRDWDSGRSCTLVHVLVRMNDMATACRLTQSKIASIREPYRNETVEHNLTSALGQRGVRAVIGAGGEVREILQSLQFRRLNIYNVPVVISADQVKCFLEQHGEIDQFKCHSLVSQSMRRLWGYVLYKTADSAASALDHSKRDSYTTADGWKFQLQLQPEESPPRCRLKLVWFPLPSRGMAFVQFPLRETAVHALSRLQGLPIGTESGPYCLSCQLDRKDDRTVFIRNLPKCVDEIQLRQTVTERCQLPPCKINVARQQRPPIVPGRRGVVDFDEEKQRLTQLVERVLPTGVTNTNYRVVTIIRNDFQPSMIVEFEDEQVTAAVQVALHGRTGLMGVQKLYALYTFSTRYRIPKELAKLQSCVTQTQAVLEKLKSTGTVNVRAQLDPKRDNPGIAIDGEEEEAVQFAKLAVSAALRGVEFDFENFPNAAQLLVCPELKSAVERIEQFTSTWIQVDRRKNTVHIHGADHETVRELLREVLQDLQTLQIPLKGEDQPPGLMKALFATFGSELNGLAEKCGLGVEQLTVNVRRHILTVCASGEKAELVRESVASLSQSCCVVPAAGSAERPDCPICLTSLDIQAYTLIVCGHQFCHSCLSQQLTSAVRNRIYPIVCPVEDCGQPFAVKDLCLLTAEGRRGRVLQAAVEVYVQRNSTKFKFCPTPNCIVVYKVTTSATVYRCPECFKSTCTACHEEGHSGFTCEEFKNPDLTLENWMATTRAGRNSRKCPSCSAVIEKIGGCQHLTCALCKKHICWTCMTVFETSGDCYAHLSSVHNG